MLPWRRRQRKAAAPTWGLLSSLEFRVQGAGCRVQGSGYRVQGSGFRVEGSGCRVQSSGLRGFRVLGLHQLGVSQVDPPRVRVRVETKWRDSL